MKGRQNPQPTLFACVRWEDLIPQDHLLRRVRAVIDFTFIDRLTAPLYSHTGRPSVDPQVLVRMMVVLPAYPPRTILAYAGFDSTSQLD